MLHQLLIKQGYMDLSPFTGFQSQLHVNTDFQTDDKLYLNPSSGIHDR